MFPLGRVVATPGALEAMQSAGVNPSQLLSRHAMCDWGDLDIRDKLDNVFSLTHNLRLMSAYRIDEGTKIWIITEADRSATTFLLPEEY